MKAAFHLFIYIVSLITIISCSSKQTDVDYPASSPLIKDLQDLNATIQSEFSVHTKASAKAIAAVAIADINGAYGGAKGGAKVGAYIGSLFGSPIYGAAVGALVGGIAIGATCSWAASPDTKSTQILDFSHVIGVCEWAMHEDVSFIINKYQRIIQDSNELNTEEKQYLCDAFATALYSFNFWSGKQQN